MSEQFNVNLQYLFVHMLVYNKHLLFNMNGMNIKVIQSLVYSFMFHQNFATFREFIHY